MGTITFLLFMIGVILACSMDDGLLTAFLLIILVGGTIIIGLSDLEKQQPADDLPKPPNYDKEALLDLMEKGECVGGTIDEGKFSVFVCKN